MSGHATSVMGVFSKLGRFTFYFSVVKFSSQSYKSFYETRLSCALTEKKVLFWFNIGVPKYITKNCALSDKQLEVNKGLGQGLLTFFFTP